VVHY
ncbi:sensory box protein, partial [Vibrio cholerae CP1035(8)]